MLQNEARSTRGCRGLTKMQEESAAQYVAKIKAKLVADGNIRMAAAKLPVTKVVVKPKQLNPVQPPWKVPPRTAPYIGPQVLHKDVKDGDYVKKAENMKKAENVKNAENVKKAEDVKKAENMKKAENVKNAENVKKAEDVKKAENVKKAKNMKKADDVKKAFEERHPFTAGYICSRELHKDVKDAQDVKKTEDVRAAEDEEKSEDVKMTEDVKKTEGVKEAEDVKDANVVNNGEVVKKPEDLNKAEDKKEADAVKYDNFKSENEENAEDTKEAEDVKEADMVKDDEPVKENEPVKESEDVEMSKGVKKAGDMKPKAGNIKAEILAETQRLEKLSEIIYQQNQTLLTAKEGILRGRDRTRLYTAHKFKLGQVRLRSKAFFQGASTTRGRGWPTRRGRRTSSRRPSPRTSSVRLSRYTKPWWRLWTNLHLGGCTRERDKMNAAYLSVHHLLELHHRQEGLLVFLLGGTGGQAPS